MPNLLNTTAPPTISFTHSIGEGEDTNGDDDVVYFALHGDVDDIIDVPLILCIPLDECDILPSFEFCDTVLRRSSEDEQ